jgi:hypothetical protein
VLRGRLMKMALGFSRSSSRASILRSPRCRGRRR